MKEAIRNPGQNKNSAADKPNSSSPDRAECEQLRLDPIAHAWSSQFTGFLSPSALFSAYSDWLMHISNSPDKCQAIYENALQIFLQMSSYIPKSCLSQECEPCIAVTETDHRFQSSLWNQFPYNIYSQFFLLNEQAWDKATTNTRGVLKHHQNLVNFTIRQVLDMLAPSNFSFTNPEVIQATFKQFGMNFVNGFHNWLKDVAFRINKQLPAGTEQFKIGENIAITPGKVIFRNHLIELIQYEPTTPRIYAEPILIVPAWIMKYYILDLSPNNSMAKYLVDQGHTVFMISWRNPDSEDRNLSMDDYVNLGVIAAINAVSHIVPQQKIHSVGYCIGGTLLMIAAAALAKAKDTCLKSITLFAAQIDFTDAGEFLLFIDENQIAYLEDIMWEKGYFDGSQMAGTLSMLRPIDLIWSKMVLDYQLGTRRPLNDLMAWDYDTTRLPYTMHSEYLRKLFLNNALVEGHYSVNGSTISLLDINIPLFVVSTLKDHIAPWKSVYKIHSFTQTDITYVLSSGGHNSGVVNEPGHPGRSYQLMENNKGQQLSPEIWQQKAAHNEGSWWPAWQQWLAQHSGEKQTPPALGNPQQGYKILCAAPGTYVFQK